MNFAACYTSDFSFDALLLGYLYHDLIAPSPPKLRAVFAIHSNGDICLASCPDSRGEHRNIG
eukprot:144167-Amphidinium_carterae.1